VRQAFSENERGAISNGLRIAADQYDRDAKTQRDAGIERMAQGFEKQAAEARELAERIEP
jgi:propanediol dehydratase small subunit